VVRLHHSTPKIRVQMKKDKDRKLKLGPMGYEIMVGSIVHGKYSFWVEEFRKEHPNLNDKELMELYFS